MRTPEIRLAVLSSGRDARAQLVFPATGICLTMLAFQAVGEGLRTATDTRESEHD